MRLESLTILDEDGNIIIEKSYKITKSDIPISKFIISSKHFSFSSNLKSYIFTLQINELFITANTSTEIPPTMIYYLLVDIVKLITFYLGHFSESVLNQHYDTVTQILEDYFDDGIPYLTEPALLKLQIPQPSLLSTVMNAVSLSTSSSSTSFSPTAPGLNSMCPWRVNGLKYAHNEIFFDVVEELDCIVDESGKLVVGTVIGLIECQSRLSGMPELSLSLGKKHLLTPGSCSFHPSVSYAAWTRSGLLEFIPPDGSFQLMEYSMDLSLPQLPLLLKPSLKIGTNKLDIRVTPRISSEKSFEYLSISVHLPGISSVHSNTNSGSCEFDPTTQILKWNIGALSVGPLVKSPFASLSLSDSIIPATLDLTAEFRVNMHSLSGISIDGIDVMNEAYKPFKGGRSYIKSGRVVFRVKQ